MNLWAWALLSPLGPRFKHTLELGSFQQSLLVAVPVVIGSLGRVPVGALTDRFGGRVMFPIVSAATVVPVLFLGLAGHSSLSAPLVMGSLYGACGSYALGLLLLAATATAALLFTDTGVRKGRRPREGDRLTALNTEPP